MDKVIFYWTIPFSTEFFSNLADMISICRTQTEKFNAVQYQDNGKYIIYNSSQKSEYSASEINQNAWKKGEFTPTFLDCYASLEEKRFPFEFKKQKKFIRFQLTQDYQQNLITKQNQNGADWEIFSRSFIQILLAIDIEGNIIITLQYILQKPNPQDIFSQTRSEFRDKLIKIGHSLLEDNSIIKKHCQSHSVPPYPFIIIREKQESPEQIQQLLESDKILYYSLWSGVQRDMPSQNAWQRFLEQNQTTRSDVYMAVTKEQAILIEARNRRKKFTQESIFEKATTELIDAREIYNDLNYLVWIQLAISIAQLAYSPYADHDDIENFDKQICGKLATRHDPYNIWLDSWKEILVYPPSSTKQNYRKTLQNFLFDSGPVDGLLHQCEIKQNLPIVIHKLQQTNIPDDIRFFGYNTSIKSHLTELTKNDKPIEQWITETRKKFRLDEILPGQSPYLITLLEQWLAKLPSKNIPISVDITILPDHIALPVEFVALALKLLCQEFEKVQKLIPSHRNKINIYQENTEKSWSIVLETLGVGLPCKPHEIFNRKGLTAKILAMMDIWFDSIIITTYHKGGLAAEGWYTASSDDNTSHHVSHCDLSSAGTIFIFTIQTNGSFIELEEGENL